MELLKFSDREAYVSFPKITPAPIMLAFHGHNGTALGFSKQKFEEHWPEAIVVYPQGLPTRSPSDSDGSGTGWQHYLGEINSLTGVRDQDLRFFDDILIELAPLIYTETIMVFGWSNGGFFVYDVLWTTRGAQLAAISGASAFVNSTVEKSQISILHIAGKTDPLVSFSQQKRAFEKIKVLNKCDDGGGVINTGDNGLIKTRFLSKARKPTVFIEYDDGHQYPSNVVPHIPRFFKNQALKILS